MCHRVESATSPPNPLLIVEARRRHIRKHNGIQTADIHTCFHRRSDGKQIDTLGEFYGWTAPFVEEYSLKLQLALLGIVTVCLTCQFGCPQPEASIVPTGSPGVVVVK